MSTLAIASILEELRCMDGELFKAEICQRLFLWLKTQANESLESSYSKTPAEYAKVLEMYRSWPLEVSREELLTLQEKAGGAEELQSAWVAVSLHWVRLHKKADANASGKTSVKIATPDPRDLLKNFFVSLCSKTWCIRGDLWSMDPVKQDFVFREVFRQSVGNSIHFLQESEARADDSVVKKQEDKKPREEETKTKRKEEVEQPKESEHTVPEEETLVNKDDFVQEKVEEKFESKEVKEDLKEPESLPAEKEEDEDDIGPDDSVSQFFSGQSVREGGNLPLPTFPSQAPPPKRYADAGTVMYSSAPRRVLVKPITLKLENPIQNNPEE
jgi:hypothetical protein